MLRTSSESKRSILTALMTSWSSIEDDESSHAVGITHDSSSQRSVFDVEREAMLLLDLQYFLDGNPERSKVKPFGSKSQGTRKPAFFDLHLHPKLRLKKIVMVHDLAQKLADTCDINLERGVRNVWKEEATEALVNGKDAKFLTEFSPVFSEETVARNYYDSSAKNCCRIASTLLFGLRDFDNAILDWDTSPEITQSHAKADGFLSVVLPERRADKLNERKVPEALPSGPATHPEPQGLLSALEPTQPERQTSLPSEPEEKEPIILCPSDRLDIELINKYHLQHTAVWEIKSLFAGNEDVMKAIASFALEDMFVWNVCGRPGAYEELSEFNSTDTKGVACSAPSKHMTYIRVSVSGRKTGPDNEATAEYWSSATGDASTPSTSKEHHFSKASVYEPQGRTSAKAVNFREKASFIVHQAWAEAVMNDASFIIFHSGNLEFIAIRHRQSQTLFISSLIDVPNVDKIPAYNRMHVGLFIASYKDTLARTKILHEWRTQFPRNEEEYPLYTHNYDNDSLEYDGIKVSRRRDGGAKQFDIDQEFHSELDNTSSFQITIPMGVLTEQTKGIIVKLDGRDASGATMAGSKGKQTDFCPALHLAVPRAAFPGTLRVWHFRLVKPSKDGSVKAKQHSKGLVIKFAEGTHEMEELYRENEIYQSLKDGRAAAYIPRIYGIFAFFSETKAGTPKKILAMVMRDAGDSIQLLRNAGRGELIQSQSVAIKKALDEIHLAGYLVHGGLNAQNILIKSSKEDPIPICFINLRSWRGKNPIPVGGNLAETSRIGRAIARSIRTDKDDLANILNG